MDIKGALLQICGIPTNEYCEKVNKYIKEFEDREAITTELTRNISILIHFLTLVPFFVVLLVLPQAFFISIHLTLGSGFKLSPLLQA